MVITSRSVDFISDFPGHNQKSDNAATDLTKKKLFIKYVATLPSHKAPNQVVY